METEKKLLKIGAKLLRLGSKRWKLSGLSQFVGNTSWAFLDHIDLEFRPRKSRNPSYETIEIVMFVKF